MGVTAKQTLPTLEIPSSPWFNLRVLIDYSPTAALVPSAAKDGLGSFLGQYGIDLPPVRPRPVDEDPFLKLQVFLARANGVSASRFSDGSFPVIYMGDEPETGLAEVTFHLSKTLSETDADKSKTHYFQVAKFDLEGQILDVRKGFPALHDSGDYGPPQAFGAQARAENRQGITFKSVRRRNFTNVAVLRADLVKSGVRLEIVGLAWSGTGVVKV